MNIMKNIFKTFAAFAFAGCLCASFTACSLEENDPGGTTYEQYCATKEGFQAVVNQIYFGMERSFYGNMNKVNFMAITEAQTDLWTTPQNKDNTNQQYFWFYGTTSPNTTYMLNFLYSLYDGIGSCNKVFQYKDLPPYNSEAERNAKVAEAAFMRALYYYHGVEQFGAMAIANPNADASSFYPEKAEPIEIYNEIIIPDLEYAIQWLPVGDDNVITRPSKKSALGLMARVQLQATRWTNDKAPYYEAALNYAKDLIADCEAGGSQYNTYMYANFEDVFAEANNLNNKEALWKHAYYCDKSYNGSSNGAHVLNMCHEFFRCQITNFPARENNADTYITWEGSKNGSFMPTQHLISLFVNADGSMDPRFAKIFQNKWNANKEYTWDLGTAQMFDKDPSVVGQTIAVGELAIEFIMPQDADYAAKKAQKHTSKHLIVDYADVYNDAGKNIYMFHNYVNTTEDYKADGTNENFFSYFYPSMTKYNTTNFFESNKSKIRYGNNSAMQLIRMPEIYLIAAEADLAVNGGANAAKYVNAVRTRANAAALGSVSLDDVLNERARELCGEFLRYYDLARTGKLSTDAYLKATHPDLAKYWNVNYVLRPYDTSTFLPSINNGESYQNPGYASIN